MEKETHHKATRYCETQSSSSQVIKHSLKQVSTRTKQATWQIHHVMVTLSHGVHAQLIEGVSH